MSRPDVSEFESNMTRQAVPSRAPSEMVGINLEKGEATFDAHPHENAGPALERLVREMWGDIDAPTFEILRVTEVTFWGDPDRPMKRFKAKIDESRRQYVDLPELKARIRKRRPRRPAAVAGERTLVALVADPQVGKASKGVGSADVAEFWIDRIGKVEDRLRDLKRLGRPASEMLVMGMGDTTEGCMDNYASQLFTVDLNESEQVEVATDLMDRSLDSWSAKVDRLRTTTVSSNHDAKRRGKEYPTGRSDCRAFTIWRSLARAYGKNDERYGHVEFWLPEDPDVAVVDVHGVGVAAIHGDLAKRGGASPELKMWEWWKGQSHGELPAGDCDVLLTAHYHHHWHKIQCDKHMFGAAAMDVVGSKWLTDSTGVWSSPGLTTLVIDENGVSDVEVL